MGFENFRLNVIARAALLFGAIALRPGARRTPRGRSRRSRAAILAVLLLVELVRYVESVNREFAEFLSFVAHDDFSASLPLARKGRVFRELESAYRLLAGKYRELESASARRTINISKRWSSTSSIALICLDGNGAVTLMNREAKALFKTPHLASLKSFARIDPQLPAAIEELADGGRALIGVKIADESLQLALFATEFELLGERYKLISFQNIRDELEQREIDYSQKLIKVLTHEIMNSVTPIISLTKLIRDRLVDEKTGELAVQDLPSDEQTRSRARPRLDPFARQRVAQVRPGLQRADQPAAAELRGRRRRGAARPRAGADGARARGRARAPAGAGRRRQLDGARRSAADRAGADQPPEERGRGARRARRTAASSCAARATTKARC